MKAPDPYDLPEIAYHDVKQFYHGETLEEAIKKGKSKFGSEPAIIFVLLPDTGTTHAHFCLLRVDILLFQMQGFMKASQVKAGVFGKCQAPSNI